MKIIRPERILGYMQDHNWTSLTALQIEKFTEDLDLSEYATYERGFHDAMVTVSVAARKAYEKCVADAGRCENCKWFANDPEVCCCEESKHRNSFVSPWDFCEEWEKDGKENT